MVGELKKLLMLLIIVLICLYSVLLSADYILTDLSRKADKDAMVIIDHGEGAASVASKLAKLDLIKSPMLFKILAKYYSYGGRYIQHGEYEIKNGDDAFKILEKLSRGERYVRKLIIPEGYTVYQALAVMRDGYGITWNLAPDFIIEEGALYPDTYHYYYGDKASKIVEVMKKKISTIVESNPIPPNSPLRSYQDVLTLASIVEKETSVPEERPIVASVYLNRLEINMPLQADPTVIYGLFDGKTDFNYKLTRDDLRKDSSYNTYMHTGLPKGPIALAGVGAIQAVLYPADTRYLYFVAVGDGSGRHNFATSLVAHNENVKSYKIASRS